MATTQSNPSAIRFEDLGEEIQGLLRALKREVSSQEIDLLSGITVREMAKVFEMKGEGQTPEKIVAWLLHKAKQRQDMKEKPRRDLEEDYLNGRMDAEEEEAQEREQLLALYRAQIASVVNEQEQIVTDESKARLDIRRQERQEYTTWYAQYSAWLDSVHAAADGLQFCEADEAKQRASIYGQWLYIWKNIHAHYLDEGNSIDFLRVTTKSQGDNTAWNVWLTLARKLDAKLHDDELVDEIHTEEMKEEAEEAACHEEEVRAEANASAGVTLVAVNRPILVSLLKQLGTSDSTAESTANGIMFLPVERQHQNLERLQKRVENLKNRTSDGSRSGSSYQGGLVTMEILKERKEHELDAIELEDERECSDWQLALKAGVTIADFREFFDHYKLPLNKDRVNKFRNMTIDQRSKAMARLIDRFGPRPKYVPKETGDAEQLEKLRVFFAKHKLDYDPKLLLASYTDPTGAGSVHNNGGVEEMWKKLKEQYPDPTPEQEAAAQKERSAKTFESEVDLENPHSEAELTQALTDFYSSLGKTPNVPMKNLLDRYLTRQHFLWKQLGVKYGIANCKPFMPDALRKEMDQSDDEKNAENPHRLKLIEYYKKHCPEKVDHVDKYLARYKGREDILWGVLEVKYGEVAEPGSPGALTRQATSSHLRAPVPVWASWELLEHVMEQRFNLLEKGVTPALLDFRACRLRAFNAKHGIAMSRSEIEGNLRSHKEDWNLYIQLRVQKYGSEPALTRKHLRAFEVGLDEENMDFLDLRVKEAGDGEEQQVQPPAQLPTLAATNNTAATSAAKEDSNTHEFTEEALEVIDACEHAILDQSCPQKERSKAFSLLARYARVMMELTGDKQKLLLKRMGHSHTAAACCAHALDHKDNLEQDQDNSDQWLQLGDILKKGEAEREQKTFQFSDWGQYVGNASKDPKTGHYFNRRQCYLNSIACAVHGSMPWESMYKLSQTFSSSNEDKNETVEMKIGGQVLPAVTAWHILEYLLSNAPPSWSECADLWKDMGDRIPHIYGYARLESQHKEVSIKDCYLKAASLDPKYCVDLASVLDEDDTVVLNGVKRSYLQLLIMAAQHDTSDNWVIWSRLWVYLSSTAKEYVVKLPDGTVVTPEYCERRGSIKLFSTHWFSTDNLKAGENYTARVAFARNVKKNLEDQVFTEERDTWDNTLGPIGEALNRMAREQYDQRKMMYDLWLKGRNHIASIYQEEWNSEILGYYRQVTEPHNAAIRAEFHQKFLCVSSDAETMKTLFQSLFESEITLYQEEQTRRIGMLNNAVADCVTDLHPTLQRLNEMNARHIKQRNDLLEAQDLGRMELEELQYMDFETDILEYYRTVTAEYNAKIVAQFKPKFEAMFAEEERARVRNTENVRVPWENILADAKASKKDCMVFEVEQGHQRTYDSNHRPFRVLYKTMTIKPAADTPLPSPLAYLIDHVQDRWGLDYDVKKRAVVYLHKPSGLRYDDPLPILGLREDLDFKPCIPPTGSTHPADYLLEQGVWMEVPEDEEDSSKVVFWNEISNDTTYDLKTEWARPATAKPVMKELAAKKIEEEKKKKAEAQKHVDPTAQPSSPKKKARGPRPAFLKCWSDEYNCYYFQNLRNNETTWDEPGSDSNIYSAVTQEGVEEQFYLNERTESRRWDLPKEGELRTLESSAAFGPEVSSPQFGSPTLSRVQSVAKFKKGEEPASPKAVEPPDVFVELISEDGTPYYMNFKTQETMWERPTVWSHSDGTPAPADQSSLLRQHSVRLFKKVADDGSGDAYYWNEKTGATRWDLNEEFEKK